MVGVGCVGIVSGNHEAGGNGHQILLLAPSHGAVNPPQHIFQEGGVSSLLGQAAYLLIVKYRVNTYTLRMAALQESLQGGKCALQVV